MNTLITFLCFSFAISVCYFIGTLIRPNKITGVKAIGFVDLIFIGLSVIGLLFIGPLIYAIIFSGLLAVVSGNTDIDQALHGFLFLGMLLSPFVIGFGLCSKKRNAKY